MREIDAAKGAIVGDALASLERAIDGRINAGRMTTSADTALEELRKNLKNTLNSALPQLVHFKSENVTQTCKEASPQPTPAPDPTPEPTSFGDLRVSVYWPLPKALTGDT